MTSITEGLEAKLKNDEDSPLLRFGLGSAYFHGKEYDKAIVHLEVCIIQDPSYSAAYKLLGRSLAETGAFDKARSVFETGLQIASAKGDKQVEREINSFLRKLDKSRS